MTNRKSQHYNKTKILKDWFNLIFVNKTYWANCIKL